MGTPNAGVLIALVCIVAAIYGGAFFLILTGPYLRDWNDNRKARRHEDS